MMPMIDRAQDYVFENMTVAQLSYPEILKHSAETVESHRRGLVDIQPENIAIDAGVFHKVSAFSAFPRVAVVQAGGALVVSCRCSTPKLRMCKHQAEVLCNIIDRPELRIFFDAKLRQEKQKAFAIDYGLENEANLDAYFAIEYTVNRFIIKPIDKTLVPFSEESAGLLRETLLPPKIKPKAANSPATNTQQILVFRNHKYYHDQFHIELYEAHIGSGGKLKAPFTLADPNFLIWKADDIETAKFYIAIARFQNTGGVRNLESNLEVLIPVARNPLRLETFVSIVGTAAASDRSCNGKTHRCSKITFLRDHRHPAHSQQRSRNQ
jgi:hypothetical protein